MKYSGSGIMKACFFNYIIMKYVYISKMSYFEKPLLELSNQSTLLLSNIFILDLEA